MRSAVSGKRDCCGGQNCIQTVAKLYKTSAKIIQLNEWGCRDGMCTLHDQFTYM